MVGVGEEFRWCIYNGWFKVGRGGGIEKVPFPIFYTLHIWEWGLIEQRF